MIAPDLEALAGAYEPQVTSFLQDLVRLPSVNGRDSEAAVARRIDAEAKRLGLASELIASDPQRPNVVVTLGEGQRGFRLDLATWTLSPPATRANGLCPLLRR